MAQSLALRIESRSMSKSHPLCESCAFSTHGNNQHIAHRFDAIRGAREWVAGLNHRIQASRPLRQPREPRFPAEDLLSIVNPDIRKPFDMGEVILRLVDDSRVSVFKPSYGRNLFTCRAEIHGKNIPPPTVASCANVPELKGENKYRPLRRRYWKPNPGNPC